MEDTKKNNITITVLLILILAGIITGLIIVRTKNTNQVTTVSPIQTSIITASPNPTQQTSEELKSISNLGITMQYPAEAKAEARTEETVIFYMGQKQIASGRTQTELFDGYSLRIGLIKPEVGKTLEQTAKVERDNAVTNCQSEKGEVSPLTASTIDRVSAFMYSAKNCYVDYTETITINKDKVYRISQSYVGDTEDQLKYKENTDKMRESIQFENID